MVLYILLLFEFGIADRVEAGAPILRIDPAKQQAVVQRSAAAVATSQADFESARATLVQLRARKESPIQG